MVSPSNKHLQTVILLLQSVSPACCSWLLPCTQAPWECSVNHAMLPAVCACMGNHWLEEFPDSETTISNFHPGKLEGGAVSTDLMEVLAGLLLNSAHLVSWFNPSTLGLPAVPAGISRAKRQLQWLLLLFLPQEPQLCPH